MKDLSCCDTLFQKKTWSKVLEAPKIQVVMHETLAFMQKTYVKSRIITNLSNSLSHKVGALKKDGVRAW